MFQNERRLLAYIKAVKINDVDMHEMSASGENIIYTGSHECSKHPIHGKGCDVVPDIEFDTNNC